MTTGDLAYAIQLRWLTAGDWVQFDEGGAEVKGVGFTVQQFKVLVAVAERQTLSEAASVLKLRQSTISFHLRQLEETAGVALFVQHQHRKELTPAGRELLPYARTILATADQAQRVMVDFQRDRQRQLTIGTSLVPATYIVPMVVQQFHQQHPGVRLTVEAVPSPLVRERIENRQIDVGFVIDAKPVVPPLAGLLVLEDEIGCVFSPNTGLQWLKPPLTADQLRAVPLIGHAEQSSTAQVCDEWAKRQGISLETFVTLGSIEMMKTAVKLDMGAALLSKMMVYKEIEQGSLLYAPLENPPTRQLQLIYHKEPEHGLLRDFIRIVREVARLNGSA